MKKSLNEEFIRMQKLAGLITESQLNEDVNSSYLFLDGDNQLELDKDEFKKYILSNMDKVKSLWGGNWDEDNIQQSEIENAIEMFWKNFLKDIQSNLDLSSPNPSGDYLNSFDENDEKVLLNRFLDYLNDTLM
jgi:flagellar capping protein FliD